jgi:hypothetical protein
VVADADVEVAAAVVDRDIAVEHRQAGRRPEAQLVGSALDERPEADLGPPRPGEQLGQHVVEDLGVGRERERLDVADALLVVAIGGGVVAGVADRARVDGADVQR